ncbi:hypothetical protein K227x_35050 [Rubripirellula lacrimiformis]|uniref:Uncharacterized protein n=1 Tax=Rubripirellula lacrimiformis TaxID=1930273 RepID=A0A517NDC5_9BACT|nr:hypothetical protein [Rubripirellula lacrimiformis]QDT05106.1 hypothetical protein K227x_35050 [Rubripirellula lacrimiformis]
MKYALVITGVLAGLAITAPQLVVLGYFLLIVPGLVLTFAPTVFIYLAVTAVVRRLLPISSPMTATAVAFGVTLLLGWAVMQPFRLAAISSYRADELPDVLSNQVIELAGHVRIERPDQRRKPECDYLALAVLDSPGVNSVTTVTAALNAGRDKRSDAQPSAAYSLVSAKADPTAGIFPHQPGRIVREYSPLVQANRGMKVITASKAVEAYWAQRLAGQDRLREVKVIDAEEADWIVRIENPSNQRTCTLRRITIFDSSGEVRFRKSYRKQAVPARMFYFGFQANMSGGPASASFHVGRRILESGERSLETESELLQAINFTVPPCDAGALVVLRDQTMLALDDPMAATAKLDLARRYLGLFFFDAKPQDHAVITRIVADDRVRDIETPIKNVFSKDKTPVAMRDSYVDRIAMDHTSASLRDWLAERLASLPQGTFANPSEKYLEIFDSPEIYQQAAPLIATLADLGPKQAMPKLDAMLDTALGIPHWRDRRALIEGIRAAFIRLGPQASAAAPRIRELFLSRPSPIMNNAGDADQWRFALARMGVALEDLPVFPNQSPKSVQRNLRQVSDKMRRYEQETTPEQEI